MLIFLPLLCMVYNHNVKEIKASVFRLFLWEIPFGKSDNSA